MTTKHFEDFKLGGKLKYANTPESGKVKFVTLLVRGEERDKYFDLVCFDRDLFNVIEDYKDNEVILTIEASQAKDKNYLNKDGREAKITRLIITGIAPL